MPLKLREWSPDMLIQKLQEDIRPSPPNDLKTRGPVVLLTLTWHLLYIFNTFIHVYSPRAGADNPPWGQMLMSTKSPYHFAHLLQVLKQSLWSLIFFHIFSCFFPHVYSPRQGQTTYWGQNFDDNRKAFSLCPYVASFKMISSKSDFIHIFYDFMHVHSPEARA